MFGGAGLFRDGLMFGLVSAGELYLKADDLTAPRFRSAGCRPFTYDKNGKTVECRISQFRMRLWRTLT